MPKSFYDLDYYIDLNEKREESLRAEYEKTMGRISNIIIIYSGISVFLIAICKDFYKRKMTWEDFLLNANSWYLGALLIFLILLIVSFSYTFRFLYPTKLRFSSPARIYNNFRQQLEPAHTNPTTNTINTGAVDEAVKGAYINEMANVIDSNQNVVRKKQAFYYQAFKYSLFSIFPFIICLIFHTLQDEKPAQIEIVSSKTNGIFVADTLRVIDVSPKAASVNDIKHSKPVKSKRNGYHCEKKYRRKAR